MSVFVSHAQNFEDVMLWRALGHVEQGFYIDLGAAEPNADSVTLAFAERGWRGINVEPSPDTFARLAAARSNDVNLNVAVSDAEGEVEFFLVERDDRLSTSDAELARQHGEAGWSTRKVAVRATTLARICREHVRSPVHFLKIDVEGAELRVLRGADFTLCRPWIILIEAVEPGSLRPLHEEWEGILRNVRYHFVYFDGLNRFYVADEHAAALDHAFVAPPNVRDGFVRSDEAIRTRLREIEPGHTSVVLALRADVSRLTDERDACVRDHATTRRALEDDIFRISTERDAWMQELFETNRHAAHLAQARQELVEQIERDSQAWAAQREAIRVSTSWRLTGPLRVLKRVLSGRNRSR